MLSTAIVPSGYRLVSPESTTRPFDEIALFELFVIGVVIWLSRIGKVQAVKFDALRLRWTRAKATPANPMIKKEMAVVTVPKA